MLLTNLAYWHQNNTTKWATGWQPWQGFTKLSRRYGVRCSLSNLHIWQTEDVEPDLWSLFRTLKGILTHIHDVVDDIIASTQKLSEFNDWKNNKYPISFCCIFCFSSHDVYKIPLNFLSERCTLKVSPCSLLVTSITMILRDKINLQ